MDKQNTNKNENLLTRMYNLFSHNKEQKSIENELKINNILDKSGGIFNFNTKDNIFGGVKEKTIFDLNNDVNFIQNKKPQNTKKTSKTGNDNNLLDPDIIKNFKSKKGGISPELGNNLDQIG